MDIKLRRQDARYKGLKQSTLWTVTRCSDRDESSKVRDGAVVVTQVVVLLLLVVVVVVVTLVVMCIVPAVVVVNW